MLSTHYATALHNVVYLLLRMFGLQEVPLRNSTARSACSEKGALAASWNNVFPFGFVTERSKSDWSNSTVNRSRLPEMDSPSNVTHSKHKLQRIQNCLARMTVTVVYRIKFQIAIVTCRTLSAKQPTYLVNLLHFCDISRSPISKQRFCS